MENVVLLEKLGLTQKQASVYLALLELGTASVQSIAQKAGLKRPTTYLILDELQTKSLVTLVPQAKKALYTTESPDVLMSDLYKKTELLKRFLPQLEALHNAKKEKPQVNFYSGKAAIAQVYDQVFANRNIDLFGSIREITKLDAPGLKSYVDRIKQNKQQVREILTDTPDDRNYQQEWVGNTPNHQVRFIPSELKFAISDSASCGDKVAYFSFHPTPFAVVITSLEVAGTWQSMFELAWRSLPPA
jgi:HTH-type transcriptional regulator, sugar sensing transcriptional regulator